MFKFQRILLILFSFVLIKRTRNEKCDETRPITIDFAGVQLSTIEDFQVYFFKELLESAGIGIVKKVDGNVDIISIKEVIPNLIKQESQEDFLKKLKDNNTNPFFNTNMVSYTPSDKINLIKCVLYYPAVVIYSESCKKFKYGGDEPNKLYLAINKKLRENGSMKDFENNVIEELSKNLKLDDEKDLIVDGNETLRNSLYRASNFNFNCDKNANEVDCKQIKNTSFISTSTDESIVKKYAGSTTDKRNNAKIKHIFHFTDGDGTDLKIKGKFIEKCSLQPSEKEFTIDKDQCWEIISVTKIVNQTTTEDIKDTKWWESLNNPDFYLKINFKLINCGTLNIGKQFII